MQRLKSLGPNHKAAARLRVMGRTNDQICAELNISKVTLTKWMSDDKLKEYMLDLAERAEEEFAIQLAQGGFAAVQSLIDMLAKPSRDSDISDNMRLEVARELMDRLPATARVRERAEPDTGGDTNFTAIFANMPDSQLAEFIQKWQAGELNGNDPRTIEGTTAKS